MSQLLLRLGLVSSILLVGLGFRLFQRSSTIRQRGYFLELSNLNSNWRESSRQPQSNKKDKKAKKMEDNHDDEFSAYDFVEESYDLNHESSSHIDFDLDYNDFESAIADIEGAYTMNAPSSSEGFRMKKSPNKETKTNTMDLYVGLNAGDLIQSIWWKTLRNDKDETIAFSRIHKEQADIVLANPPFAGAIDKDEMSDEFRLTIKTKAFLFVDLFEQILFEGGRAAVIVPEGVLFNRNPQPIMNLKRLLENNTLEAIISLPQGVFSPYSKVKTSIVIWRKGGRTDVVPMFEMKNDGYSLDDIRKKIPENDIPKIINSWDKRKNKDLAEKNNWLLVPIDKIEKNKYDLKI